MSPAAKKSLAAVGVAAVSACAIFVWHVTHKPTDPIVDTTRSVADFDQFQQDLAMRALKEIGGGGDLSAIVAAASYPVGTLLRATGSVPADLDDCVPSTLPKPYDAQRLFPSYTLSTDTALAADLGTPLKRLADAGISLHHSQTVEYSIANTQILIMDDKSVAQITESGNCGKYVAAHPGLRLIRGAVTGKITFTVKVDNPASVKTQLAKFGGFSIDDNPQSSTISVADRENEPIVELLSQFAAEPPAPEGASAPKPLEMARPPSRSPASVEEGQTHIFVQMDAQDTPSSGDNVVQLLRTSWPSAVVESTVEKIVGQKAPDTAQVRYFNQADAEIAAKCVSFLSKAYPDVRAIRIGLPSPKGQLEVWLPRFKRAQPASTGSRGEP